jgi:RecB family endonuclease NucS
MSAIWRREEDEWRPLLTSGFATEEALHDLVEEAPHLLPLSGDPTLVVVGREVALGSGYADLVAVEPDGRLSVIEIKLRRNAEARRAVVAQVLMYAAFLKGIDARTLERDVLGSHISSPIRTSRRCRA